MPSNGSQPSLRHPPCPCEPSLLPPHRASCTSPSGLGHHPQGLLGALSATTDCGRPLGGERGGLLSGRQADALAALPVGAGSEFGVLQGGISDLVPVESTVSAAQPSPFCPVPMLPADTGVGPHCPLACPSWRPCARFSSTSMDRGARPGDRGAPGFLVWPVLVQGPWVGMLAWGAGGRSRGHLPGLQGHLRVKLSGAN